MDLDKIRQVGQWLNFKAGTCFGETKDHLGFFVAISEELSVCIAINATSNVNGVKNFASRRNIDSDKTVVVIKPSSPEASLHFSKETAFDCNRPSVVSNSELTEWIRRRKIEIADFNAEVNEELLAKIQDGILKSPLVSKRLKKLIEESK